MLDEDVWWWCTVMMYDEDVLRGCMTVMSGHAVWWWPMVEMYDDCLWLGCTKMFDGDDVWWACTMRVYKVWWWCKMRINGDGLKRGSMMMN